MLDTFTEMDTPGRVLPAAVLALVLVLVGCGTGGDPTSGPRAEVDEVEPAQGPIALVLGSAQDGGFPHAGCTCPHCEAARRDPAHRRRIASLGVVFPRQGIRFLIDATPDVRLQLDALRGAVSEVLDANRPWPVDGVLLTHAHIGHYLGLAFFGYESMHTRGVPVYGTPAMGEFLASNAPWDQLVRLENIVPISIPVGRGFRLHERLTVTALRVPHRDEYADTVGFLLHGPRRTLLYVPDTDSWDLWEPTLVDRLEGVDVALLDGTFYSPEELPDRDLSAIGHPLIVRSMDLLEPLVRSGRLEVYFTHLNHSNLALEPEGEAARTIRERGFHLAQEGQEIPL